MKPNYLILAGSFGLILLSLAFFPWPRNKSLKCEIQERVGDSVSMSHTQTLRLQVQDNKPDGKTLESQVVKDLKVHIGINQASLNLFKIFDQQIVIPAWQITQVFEDTKSGVKTTGYTILPKVLGDLRSADWKFIERPNGDHVDTLCYSN
jgi:hypothetical protein